MKITLQLSKHFSFGQNNNDSFSHSMDFKSMVKWKNGVDLREKKCVFEEEEEGKFGKINNIKISLYDYDYDIS